MNRPQVLVSANAAPGVGGQGVCLQNTLDGLCADFDIALFAASAGTDIATTVVAPSALARAIGALPVLRRRRDWLVLAADSGFDRRVAALPWRGALFHGATGQCVRSLRAARARGMVTALDVVTLHVDQFVEAAARECARFGVRPPIHPRQAARIRREYAEADLIRTMSARARTSLLERGVRESAVVAALPPFDLSRFPRAEFRHEAFRVAFVGSLDPWKGFHYLVEAFESLAMKESALVLWGGSGARGVSRWIAERTSRNPRITTRAVDVARFGFGRVYGEATVCVHPSLTDGFGLVVGEAMACGIPVICSDAAGAADLIEDGVNGYLVPPADADAIRERLEHLAANSALVRTMGAAARATMATLTLDRFRAAWLPRLRSLLPQGAGTRPESRPGDSAGSVR